MSTSNPAAREADDYVRIFDTTLRDGEQSPGATMNLEEKVTIARQLERLNVDIIEAGFAASSPGDLESVRRVAETVTTPVVLSLARTTEGNVEQALRAVEKAAHPGIHIFIATSDIHLKYKLQMNREDVLNAATVAVAADKAPRSYRVFLRGRLAQRLGLHGQPCSPNGRAGAKILNIPDTTGHAIPEEYGRFAYLREHVPGSDRVTWSAHCHNDLGLAVANSLSAIKHGVRQVECTINGIGERAGNTSMEEVVMALRTRKDLFGIQTRINTPRIYPPRACCRRSSASRCPPINRSSATTPSPTRPESISTGC